jgi:hypothetical protein
MSTTEKKDDRTIEHWTYAGLRLSAKGKVFGVWIDPTERELWYDKLHKYPIVGGVYAVKVTRGEGSVTAGTAPDYVRTGSDPRIPEWRALDASAHSAKALKSKATKARAEWAEALGPIRDAYRSAVGPQKVAVLAAVINYITGAGGHIADDKE